MEMDPSANLLSFMLHDLLYYTTVIVILLSLFFRLVEPTLFYRQVYRSFGKMVELKVDVINKDDSLRFHKLLVSWLQDPCERDARYIKEAFLAVPVSKNVIMEIACTRSSFELVATKRAYQSIFKTTIGEDVARYITRTEVEHKVLTALMNGYRYEGEEVNEDLAKSDALRIFYSLSVQENPLLDDYIVMIVASRSVLHIKSLLQQYQETIGNSLYEELRRTHSFLKDTLQCLCSPTVYFCKVVEAAILPGETNETRKEDLARVIVTRTGVDMKDFNV